MLVYVVAFLPATILLYQLVPQKFRYIVLLCANCIFFCSFSKGLIIYLIAAILVAYFFARWIEKIGEKKSDGQKAVTKAKRKVLALGIVLNLLVLVVLKYTNFFAKSFIDLTNVFGSKWKFAPIRFLVPIGIFLYVGDYFLSYGCIQGNNQSRTQFCQSCIVSKLFSADNGRTYCKIWRNCR